MEWPLRDWGKEEEKEGAAMESSMKQVVVEEPMVSPCDPHWGGSIMLRLPLCPAEMLSTGLCPLYPRKAPVW